MHAWDQIESSACTVRHFNFFTSHIYPLFLIFPAKPISHSRTVSSPDADLLLRLYSNWALSPSSRKDPTMNFIEVLGMISAKESEMGSPEVLDMVTPGEATLKCFCGHPAKLQVSRTAWNPSRLFYNCPIRFQQCGFFKWADEPAETDDKHVNEMNLIRHECLRFQQQHDADTSSWQREKSVLLQEHEDARSAWHREKSELLQQHEDAMSALQRENFELTSKLSIVQAKNDDYEQKIKAVLESDLMPSLDKLSNPDDDDEGNDAIIICTV